MLDNTFGIIWYYTVLYSSIRENSNYTDSYTRSIENMILVQNNISSTLVK